MNQLKMGELVLMKQETSSSRNSVCPPQTPFSDSGMFELGFFYCFSGLE